MHNQSDTSSKQRNPFLLWGASLTATIGGFLFGFDTAVISGTITFVTTQFHLSTLAEGWFVSSALVGCIVGVAFAGMLSDRFGRKKILILSSLLFLVSTLGCTFAPSHIALIFSRLVAGLAIGVASMLAPLYISEIAPPSIRGRLVSLYQFAITIGILCAYFSNAWILNLSQGAAQPEGMLQWIYSREVWRGMFGTMIIPDIAFIVLLLFVPESPRWLISRGLTEKAKAVLAKIQRAENISLEYEQIASTIGREKVSMAQLLNPAMRVPLLIGILLPVFSQFSGINAIIYYGPKILKQAGLSISDALGGQVLIGFVNVLFTLLAIWQVDKLGRKPLLLYGISGACISLLAVGLFFELQIANGALLIIFIMFFIACFAFSYGPVTWIVISEIFPTHIRGRAMSIGIFALWGANAIVGQVLPWMLERCGPGGTFWIFAALCLPALLLVWKLLPETKGRSLEEIEHQLYATVEKDP
ncbi:MAG: sugar porter family MFS transporter [Bacteroidota bacterium]